MHPRVRLLRKFVDEQVEVAGKTASKKRKTRQIEKKTRKNARTAIIGELAALVADGISKKEICKTILPRASAGKKNKKVKR